MSGNEHQESQDRYYLASHDAHTAIPDWVPFCASVSVEARNLIIATLVLQKRGKPPTRKQLAAALGVDERSIYRWLEELTTAKIAETHPRGRARLTVFSRPIPDRAITDRAITDQAIRYRESSAPPESPTPSHDQAIPDRAITDPPLVGWLDHDSQKENQPTKQQRGRKPLKTPLAKWLRHQGMRGANLFDDPALDFDTYRYDFERKQAAGWPIGLIVNTWLTAPPEKSELDYLRREDEAAIADDLAAAGGQLGDRPELQGLAAQIQENAYDPDKWTAFVKELNDHPHSYHGGKK